jgi:hypothetical protein
MKNKKLIAGFMIWPSLILILVHAFFKLQAANWMDWQHWGVLILTILTGVGVFINNKRK